jgi:pantoate--beta-alanine ligase
MPSASEIYPDGFSTTVHVSGVAEQWEGEARPGHFDGVATIVAKLLLAVRPSVALFGEKDFQQLAVIRRMVEDLNIAVEIVAVPRKTGSPSPPAMPISAKSSAQPRRHCPARWNMHAARFSMGRRFALRWTPPENR